MSASISRTHARTLPALRLLTTGTVLTTGTILATGAATAPDAEAAARLATPYRCTTQPLLKNGSTGECSKAVQWTLNSFVQRTKQKGAPLALTGLYGPRTTTLVRALQQAYNVPTTGVIDARTWPVVVKEAARVSVTTATRPTSPSTPRPATTPSSTVSRYTTTTNVHSAGVDVVGGRRQARRRGGADGHRVERVAQDRHAEQLRRTVRQHVDPQCLSAGQASADEAHPAVPTDPSA